MLWILCIVSATPRDTMYGLVFNRNAEIMSWKYKLGIGLTAVHPSQELGFVSPDSFGKYIGWISEDYVMGYGWSPSSNWDPTTYRQFPFDLNEIDNDGGSSKYDTLAFLAIQHGTDNDKGGLWPFWMWPWTDLGLDSLDTHTRRRLHEYKNSPYDISVFTFFNEPDHYRWRVQMGYFSVFVDSTDTAGIPRPYQIIDTTIADYRNTTADYRIRVTRLLDTTRVGGVRYATTLSVETLAVLEFSFDSIDGQFSAHKLTDTALIRVSSAFRDSCRTVFWGPEYMARVICPIVDDARDDTLPDVLLMPGAAAFNIAFSDYYRATEECVKGWVTKPQFYFPYIIDDGKRDTSDTSNYFDLRDWWTRFFSAGGWQYIDLVDYHLYMGYDLFGTEGEDWWDPYDTLKTILDTLKAMHQGFGANNKKVWISEFGGVTGRDDNTTYPDSSRQRQAWRLVHYMDCFRHYFNDQSFNIEGVEYFCSMMDYWDEHATWGVLSDTNCSQPYTPKPAYYAYQNYLQAYSFNDTLLASRHPKATFGSGNKIDEVYTDEPPVHKYWVAFPFKQYDPASKALVLKGIRVIRIDTLGNPDSVINLTGSPYNKVDQLALASANNAPCVAFRTSDSGNIYYAYIGASVSRTLLWRNDAYRDSAYFPLLENEGNYIHLAFYGKSSKPEYGNGIHWMKFAYNNPGNPAVNTSIYYGEIPDWISFDLNSNNRPWIVWEHGDSVYLVRHTGLAWDDFKTVASSHARWPDIAMSGQDTVWVTWHNSDKDSVFVKGYQPYNHFGTPIFSGSVGPARAEASYPRIDYYSNKAYILWADSNRVEIDPQTHSVNPYKPWSYDMLCAHGRSSFTRTSMGDTPLHSLYPSFFARPPDMITVLWTEGEYDTERVWVRSQVVE